MQPGEIIIEEISGSRNSGMTLINGRWAQNDDLGGHVNLILAGEGSYSALQKAPRVEVGGVVGISAPAWDITLEGTKWCVAVDWKIVS